MKIPSLHKLIDILKDIFGNGCNWQTCPECKSILLNGKHTKGRPLPDEWLNPIPRLCDSCWMRTKILK